MRRGVDEDWVRFQGGQLGCRVRVLWAAKDLGTKERQRHRQIRRGPLTKWGHSPLPGRSCSPGSPPTCPGSALASTMGLVHHCPGPLGNLVSAMDKAGAPGIFQKAGRQIPKWQREKHPPTRHRRCPLARPLEQVFFYVSSSALK